MSILAKKLKYPGAVKKCTIKRVFDVTKKKIFGLELFSMKMSKNKILKHENLCSKVSGSWVKKKSPSNASPTCKFSTRDTPL